LTEIALYTPGHWEDYELIDTGGLEKLERFGKFILTRPEPQAVWEKSLPETEWNKLSHAIYKRTRGIDPSKTEYVEKGDWQRKHGMPDQWVIEYSHGHLNLKFRLGLTSFGHIGVFPEQAVNWEYIFDFIKSVLGTRHAVLGARHSVLGDEKYSGNTENREPRTENRIEKKESASFKVLNLFAYTGGSSLAAKSAGADVVHVDSVKPVINWAKEDMKLTRLTDIRWVVEDALKFVRREVKRGNRYDGIILDPPAYGRGPEGEKWVLQESVNEMVGLCSEILNEKNSFFILSLYSMGFSSLISESLVKTHFGNVNNQEAGELFFSDRADRKLPLGTFLRFRR
jgi:23S rRNA (cytosine1962-C5)-methyltransferase